MRAARTRFQNGTAIAVMLVVGGGCQPAHIVVRAERPALAPTTEAVLVLPGLGYPTEGSADIARFAARLSDEGYDVFVPAYAERDSIDASADVLLGFIDDHALASYTHIHVFAYILGGVVLNRVLARRDMPNLASIVYDRGPLQERADVIVTTRLPLVAKALIGQVVFELAELESAPYEGSARVGIIVENRATWFVRLYERDARALGPITFAPDALGQPLDDGIVVWLDHFEMYHRFDIVGDDVVHFFAHGRFRDESPRVASDNDPFAW
jgi:hypothetical protein